MKQRRVVYLITCLCLILAVGPVTAGDLPPLMKAHEWEIAPVVSFLKYEEPHFMENRGTMAGLNVKYVHRSSPVMVALEGRYLYGLMEYKSDRTGSTSGITDQLFEVRALLGHPYLVDQNRIRITPYVGIAYRYLLDDSSGKGTTTGHWGFRRESNYFYSPVGLEVAWTTSPDWSLGLYGEYDVFWGGQQKSYLSDVNAGYNDVENRQGSGYGLKGGFFVRRHFDNLYALILEPYVHYWDVSRSDVSIVTYRGKPVTYGVEPDNNTLEVGLKLGLFF